MFTRCGISGCRATAAAAGDLRSPHGIGCPVPDPHGDRPMAGISTRAAVISTPIFFVAVGLVLAEGLHLFDVETDSHQVKIIAEVTLVWVLFADASRIRYRTCAPISDVAYGSSDSAFR
jgi:hypothetical protein